MSGRPPLSFVVIAYNEEAAIADCLGAIEAQEGLGEHEVVVVDDGSSDGTAERVRAFARRHPAVALVSQENRGRGAARAAGLEATKGELVAMVDGDIRLPAGWLERCLAELADHDAVGGTPVPDGDVAYLHRRFRLDPRPVPTTMEITGSNALYRREVFALASFDPRLRDGEDIALNHELRRQGCRVRSIPGLLVEHREDKPFGASLRWLYQSGLGATRQLFAYRQVRPPDLAYAGLLGTLALAGIGRWRRRRGTLALPGSYLALVSARHLHSKFSLRADPGYLARYLGALLADGALLAAYFAGRSVGVATWLGPGRLRRLRSPGQAEPPALTVSPERPERPEQLERPR